MAAPQVYADLTFFGNGLLDFWILALTGRASRSRPRSGRLAMAGAFGGLYSVAVLFPLLWPLAGIGGKLFASAVMVALAFWSGSARDFGRKAVFFYASAFGVAGCAYGVAGLLGSAVAGVDLRVALLISAPLEWYLAGAVGAYVAAREQRRGIVPLTIQVAGLEITLTALVDTGNLARDPFTRAPVVFIERRELGTFLPDGIQRAFQGDAATLFDRLAENMDPDWARRLRVVPVHAIGGGATFVPAFRPDALWTDGRRERAVTSVVVGVVDRALSADGTYHALLPSVLRGEPVKADDVALWDQAEPTTIEGGAS